MIRRAFVASAVLIVVIVCLLSTVPGMPPGSRRPERSAHQVKARQNDPVHDGARATLRAAIDSLDTELEVIANNIANAETPGYKTAHVVLEDSQYRHEAIAGVEDASGQYAAVGICVGTGCRVAAVETDFSPGRLRHTRAPLDLAIDGIGFFQVLDPSGATLYCRAGHFTKNSNGNLVIASADTCRLLHPPITIPDDALSVLIGREGIVSVERAGSAEPSQVGQIELARFVNPAGLKRIGENLYAETAGSGPPLLANPGAESLGPLRQGWLESSNVNLDEQERRWTHLRRRLQRVRRLP